MTPSPHELVNPESLLPPQGFSHAVVPAAGRTVYLAGQTGHRADGSLPGPGLVEQMDQALANVVEALAAAGGDPSHIVSMHILCSVPEDYRSRLRQLGSVWRDHLGRHYPAVTFVGVTGLFDPEAVVELVCVAVVPATEAPATD